MNTENSNNAMQERIADQLYQVFKAIEQAVKPMKLGERKDFLTGLSKAVKDNTCFSDLHLQMEMQKPAHEEKGLCIQSAFFRITDNDILGFLDDIYTLESFIEENKPDSNRIKEHDHWLKAYQTCHKLKDYANGELYERIQLYKNDIEVKAS